MAKSKFMGKKINLPKVRLSFPDLYTPRAFEEGQDEKYRATFLLDVKGNPEHKKAALAVKAEIDRAIAETWGTAPHNLKQECFGKGELKRHTESGEIYDGYEGMYFVTASGKSRPLLLDKEKNELKNGDERLYGGVFVDATVNLFITDHPKWGKRVSAGLRAVRTLGYGDPFGMKVDASEFEDFDAGDDFGDDDGLG